MMILASEYVAPPSGGQVQDLSLQVHSPGRDPNQAYVCDDCHQLSWHPEGIEGIDLMEDKSRQVDIPLTENC